MTSPTTDTPDWVPGSTGLTVFRKVFDTGPAYVTSARLFVVANLQPWTSLNVALHCFNNTVTTTTPQAMILTWTGAGDVVFSQVYTFGPVPAGQEYDYYMRIPVLGDTLDIQLSPDYGPNPCGMLAQIYGTTVPQAGFDISPVSPYVDNQILVTHSTNVPASTTITYELSPVPHGYGIYLSSPGVNLTAMVYAYTTTGSGWVQHRIGGVGQGRDPGNRQEVHVSGQACQLHIVNADTASAGIDLTITSLAA